MPQQSLVSIIIPTLNEQNNILLLLENLQKPAKVELIVCDGGSSDATLEVCHDFPVRVISAQRGRGIQMNTGAECAQGEIYLFLHADSLIESRVIEDIRDAVSLGDQWGCCTLQFNDSTLLFRVIAFLSNLRAKVFSSCYGDQGIYCERDLFWENNGFPETVFLEDMEFSRRLRSQKRARIVNGIITTSTRFREAGIWRSIYRNQVVKVLYALGVKPERLWQWYRSEKQATLCERQ
ncbi:MAG: TIGR04283 family arsenosugar biosynthesis glycosyltransferase [Syntrophomonas sp.]